ncbi:MAG: NADH-quinone oxidoreductase subunit M [Candidatus Lokiarchaeota archaeon]|nr:NADH-quinone oxidoreductase subunit M [Candidatus Lokiarchaeota archaeon]
MGNILWMPFLLPVLASPFVYWVGKKSGKLASTIVVAITLFNIVILLTTIPSVLDSADHKYIESYTWIPELHSSLTFFVDGISLPITIVTLVLITCGTLFSVDYMKGRKSIGEYYFLVCLLSVGLVGVFITSNLMLFYFCWEMMLIPSFFLIGHWGYKDAYKVAFKFFIFTHAGAVFVLLGIGAIFIVTNDLDLFSAKAALLTASPDVVRWLLISLTGGFAVKMAIVPVHMWLPDAHSEAPAPMSALLSGVIISAGAYAIFRICLETVLPAVFPSGFGTHYLYGLAIFGLVSAFLGSFVALVETDIKRIIAYSSIAHMGYVLFGFALFPFEVAMIGTILHIVTHALSKGLFFLSSGAVMKELEIRDIREMGGLASAMPVTAFSSVTAGLSIAGIPPFACFISEFMIFVGAFQVINADGFFLIPTILMLVATVFSLAYSLRYVSKIFLGQRKIEKVGAAGTWMRVAMAILVVLIVCIGVWPGIFVQLISTTQFIP